MKETTASCNGNGHSPTRTTPPSFRLGRTLATPGALRVLKPEEILQGLARHARCDWGEVDDEDKSANDFAVTRRLRILSAYRASGVKFWIITEADRSATTVLLPDEY